MKAIIIKKIETKILDISEPYPIWVEVETPSMDQIIQEGAEYKAVEFNKIAYIGCKLWNPEKKTKEMYYVRQNDKKLFEDLTIVSNSFIEKKVEDAQKALFEEMEMKLIAQRKAIKEFPWWKRLFNKF